MYMHVFTYVGGATDDQSNLGPILGAIIGIILIAIIGLILLALLMFYCKRKSKEHGMTSGKDCVFITSIKLHTYVYYVAIVVDTVECSYIIRICIKLLCV